MVDNSDIFQSQRQCFCLCLVQRIPHPLAVKQMEQIKEMYVMGLGINKNSFGLKTSPWGTPHLALLVSDPVEAKVSCCSSQLPALTGVLLAQVVHFYSVHLSYFVYLAKSRYKGSAAFKLSKAYIWISCCKLCSSSSSKGHKYLLFPFLLHPFFRYLYVRPPSGQTIKHSWQAKNRNCQLLPLKAMVGCCTLLI